MRTPSRRPFCLLSLLLLGACYSERELAQPVPPPTTRIVAELTDQGTASLGEAIGPGAVEVEAIVATANSDAWSLHLLRVEHRDGRSISWNRELVNFPRTTLTKVVERRLDKTKSWLAAGAITAGAIIAARMFELFGSGEGTRGDPVPQEIMVPVGGRRE